jgi:ABC-type branched-subunit amino acid transport system ATPase component
MEAILNLQNLCKHFEGIVAVDQVNFAILPGTITGIFGDNGAGKTTLFNLISGFERPDSGTVIFDGNDITHLSVLKRARLGIGRLFQVPRVFSDITVLDNLLAAGNNHEAKHLRNYLLKPSTIEHNSINDLKRAYNILKQFHLTGKATLKAFKLSVGEKKLLSLGCLWMNEAKFLLLDEPFAGINENAAPKIRNTIDLLKRNGITLLIIEHDKLKLFDIADIVFEMKQGKLNNLTITDHASH